MTWSPPSLPSSRRAVVLPAPVPPVMPKSKKCSCSAKGKGVRVHRVEPRRLFQPVAHRQAKAGGIRTLGKNLFHRGGVKGAQGVKDPLGLLPGGSAWTRRAGRSRENRGKNSSKQMTPQSPFSWERIYWADFLGCR